MSENEGENRQSMQELLEKTVQEEMSVEQLFDELSNFEQMNGDSLGRNLGGLVGCGLGMLAGRKLGASLGSRLEGRFGKEEAEPSREQVVRQRVQDAFEVSKEEAKQIIAGASTLGGDGDEGDEAAESSNETEGTAEESTDEEEAIEEDATEGEEEADGDADDEPGEGLDLDELSDDELQSLADDLLTELEGRKAA